MRIFNGIVTNKYMVKLSYAPVALGNRLADLSRGAKRRRKENRSAVSAYTAPGHINGQARGGVARLPYGKFTMGYNGCEVIACRNALETLGDPASLADAAAWFERRGLFLAGRWGTHVLAIPRFFKSRGFVPRTLYASSVKRPGDWDAAFAGAKAAVFSFWNSAARLRDGVHTVALARGPDGGVLAYNMDTRSPAAAKYRSVAEMIETAGILPILLVTLKEENNGNA